MRWGRAVLVALWAVVLAQPCRAQPVSDCIALARGTAPLGATPVAFGEGQGADQVALHYIDHAMFAIRSPGGKMVVTDYNGRIGGPNWVPDAVTMNHAHDTHFTEHPDPRIPLVLRGWPTDGQPAAIEVQLGDIFIRNVTTDLRGPFGEGAEANGNSIFIFELGGLCIGHLGHLHQIPSPAQYAAIGRMDVVMVPVDGGYTMTQTAMAGVVRALHPRVVIPMHWFSDAALASFLDRLAPDFDIRRTGGADLVLSRSNLPARPAVIVLTPLFLP